MEPYEENIIRSTRILEPANAVETSTQAHSSPLLRIDSDEVKVNSPGGAGRLDDRDDPMERGSFS